MRFRPPSIFLAAACFGALAGCSDYQHAERPPWRVQAEDVCLAKGLVTETSSVRAFHELSGPGICGAVHPFKVTALDRGSVALNATQTLDCPMIAALDAWVRDVVQPAAEARFGERVVGIDSMGSYNCRGINNMSGATLSEHSFANAIDIGGFTLASGRTLSIMKGFNGPDAAERAFLHEAHAGACAHFTTVLGPGYNIFHYNHFHMDLAMHGATSRGPRRYCKPVPTPTLPEPPVKDAMPDPPAIEDEMDIARAPLPEPSYRSGPPTLVASAPPPAPAMSYRAAAAAPRPVAAPLAPVVPPMSSAPRSEPAEPPLISFADAPEDEARPVRPPRARPPGALALGPSEASPRPQRGVRAEPPAPDADGTTHEMDPAGRHASPTDWDVTSSVGR